MTWIVLLYNFVLYWCFSKVVHFNFEKARSCSENYGLIARLSARYREISRGFWCSAN